jgi:phosphoenolpyruvate carboxylase
MLVQQKSVKFNQNILPKYLIYNGIFITLPFDAVTKTGVLLP